MQPHPQHTSANAQAPSPARSIPLDDLRLTLKTCKARRMLGVDSSGQLIARYAAWTRYPITDRCCRDSRYEHRPLKALHFGPMCSGDMNRVLERTRLAHGLAEVRRTWGAGLRAMEAEFKNVVMR